MNQLSTEHVKYFCIYVVALSMNRLKEKKLVFINKNVFRVNKMVFWYSFTLDHNVYIY